MTIPILIVTAFPERLPKLAAEIYAQGRSYVGLKAPVGREATLKPDPYWRDDVNPKLLSWGELACFEGHRKAWRHVVECDEPFIVLEDDAKVLKRLPTEHPGEGLYYLGFKPMLGIERKREAAPGADGWRHAPFCWWALGYMLTPEVAAKLLSFEGDAIPVDEFIPAHYAGTLTENRLGLIDIADLPHFNAFIPVDGQPFVEPRGFESTTDVHDPAFDLKTVVFATDAGRIAPYAADLRALGHDVTIMGTGKEGWDTSGEGGRQKLEWLAEAGFDDRDIVLCLDGYDTRVLASPARTLKAYGAMRFPVVVSGEKNYWPERGLRGQFEGGESPYPCSGLMIGTYRDLKGLAEASDDLDDQAIVQRAVIEHPDKWWVDTVSTMFRSLHEDESREIAEGTVAYHWNGRARPAPARWLDPHDNYILEVAPDILQFDLMPQDEADWLYRALMREDGWGALPGDAVPGDEMRLGFRGPIASRVTDLVYRRWQPARWQKIKDLFAIRYTKGRQPDLSLHVDKSYFSMSILLHREGAGGELCFPRQTFTDRHMKPGQALVWPSGITHPHMVTPIDGVRMSLVVWTSSPAGF